MMKKKDDGTVFGIGIYRKEQWPLLLETSEDRAGLEDTYEEWELNLKKSCGKHARARDGAARGGPRRKRISFLVQDDQPAGER